MSKKRICWITASYFLDVDLPVVPGLQSHFDIDWFIVTTRSNADADRRYIMSQSDCPFEIVTEQGYFFSPSHLKILKDLVRKISAANYDLYYFDISDMLFLFPLVRKYIPISRTVVATHNVTVPKGARYAFLAQHSMNYILRNFRYFQVFSLNQYDALLKKSPVADVFYCPLMLKHYGDAAERVRTDKTRFLFFGNIVRYKRVDLLIEAANRLREMSVNNFEVNICGYCRPEVWARDYEPLIRYPETVKTDIRRIPNEEVAALFANNDFFMMPYQDIAQSGAMTVAFNYNMPVIASDLPTFREFVEHDVNCLFFRSEDVSQLVEMMKKAIDMDDLQYAEMRHNLQEMVDRKLSRTVILSKYTDYLNHVINA